MNLRVAAVITAMTLIWGSTWAAIRIGLQDIPPFAGVAMRFAVASVLLFVLARVLGIGLGKSRREVVLWWVNGLLVFVATYGIVYWAEQRVPSGLTAVLFATFPLFVALLAQVVLPAERFTLRSAVGIVLGFVGVAVIFSEDLGAIAAPGAPFAAAVVLLGSFSAAVANVSVKRWGKGIHPISLTAVPMAISAVVMGGISLAVERGRPFELTPLATGTVLYLAVLGSAFTFYCYFWLMERMPATKVALTNYGSPVVAVLIGAFVLDEALTARVVVGTLLVISGVGITLSRGALRRAAAERRPVS